MKLLLDTHIWLWSLLDPRNLSAKVAAELENPLNEIWLSPISIWELLILVGDGRVSLASDPGEWVQNALSRVAFKEAYINNAVVLRTRQVNLPDLLDRFLVASALVYDLTLVTADERLFRSEASILANR